MRHRFIEIIVLALALGASACGIVKSPTAPSPPTATLQILDLKLGVVNGSELGGPLPSLVSPGTQLQYNLIYGSPTSMGPELTVTFETIRDGVVVKTDSGLAMATAGSRNRAASKYTPMVTGNYMVRVSLSGATPPTIAASYDVGQ